MHSYTTIIIKEDEVVSLRGGVMEKLEEAGRRGWPEEREGENDAMTHIWRSSRR